MQVTYTPSFFIKTTSFHRERMREAITMAEEFFELQSDHWYMLLEAYDETDTSMTETNDTSSTMKMGGLGITNYCNVFVIEVLTGQTRRTSRIVETLFHEFAHMKQYASGRLERESEFRGYFWLDEYYPNLPDDHTHQEYLDLPWEKEARDKADELLTLWWKRRTFLRLLKEDHEEIWKSGKRIYKRALVLKRRLFRGNLAFWRR